MKIMNKRNIMGYKDVVGVLIRAVQRERERERTKEAKSFKWEEGRKGQRIKRMEGNCREWKGREWKG